MAQITDLEAVDLTGIGTDGEQTLVLSIDPGERHCGFALFDPTKPVGERCTHAWEMAPHQAILFVRRVLRWRRIKVLLVEQFRLYPWLAEQQAFSSFKTVEVIGVLRYLWAEQGEGCEWVENPATVMKPTKAILQAKKIRSRSKAMRAGDHAQAAELHGWHYLLHQAGEAPAASRGRGGSSARTLTAGQGKATKRPPKPTGAAGAAKAVKKATRKRATEATGT